MQVKNLNSNFDFSIKHFINIKTQTERFISRDNVFMHSISICVALRVWKPIFDAYCHFDGN